MKTNISLLSLLRGLSVSHDASVDAVDELLSILRPKGSGQPSAFQALRTAFRADAQQLGALAGSAALARALSRIGDTLAEAPRQLYEEARRRGDAAAMATTLLAASRTDDDPHLRGFHVLAAGLVERLGKAVQS